MLIKKKVYGLKRTMSLDVLDEFPLLNVELDMAYNFGKLLKKVKEYVESSYGTGFKNLTLIEQVAEYKLYLLQECGREINFNIDSIMFESNWDLSDYGGTYNRFGFMTKCDAILCAVAHGFLQDNVVLTSSELLKNPDVEVKQKMLEIKNFMERVNLELNIKVISVGNLWMCFYTLTPKAKSNCSEESLKRGKKLISKFKGYDDPLLMKSPW